MHFIQMQEILEPKSLNGFWSLSQIQTTLMDYVNDIHYHVGCYPTFQNLPNNFRFLSQKSQPLLVSVWTPKKIKLVRNIWLFNETTGYDFNVIYGYTFNLWFGKQWAGLLFLHISMISSWKAGIFSWTWRLS